MTVEFRMPAEAPPGAVEASRAGVENLIEQYRVALQRYHEELQEADSRNDLTRVEQLERELSNIVMHAASFDLEVPKDLKYVPSVKSVRWEGEPALLHLVSLGFRRPTTKHKLRRRARDFADKLFRDGKVSLLPKHLFQLSFTLKGGLRKYKKRGRSRVSREVRSSSPRRDS